MVYIWLGVMIASIVLELLTPSALLSIWFAIGSLLAMVLACFGVMVELQLIVFAVGSILALIIVRPLATKYLRGNIVATNADRFIGETGIVTQDITENKWGEVYVKATYWSAVALNGNTILKDTRIKVIAIEGAKLIVEEIE